MSLIYTCQLNEVNPFDYLTQLQEHAEQVAANPPLWMPWNYREALTTKESGVATTCSANETAAMSRHKPKKRAPTRKQEESAAPLRQALARRRKAELVDVLVELAQADRGVLRQLTARFDVAAAPVALVAATRQAIADATAFDEREMNCNFAYDYEAYGEVKRNLSRLIASGQLRLAMQLALELMKQGSYQVEMSDEGLMTDDIEDGLRVVHQALAKGELPAAEVIAWCSAMLDSDHVGFIAREPLQALRKRFQGAGAR